MAGGARTASSPRSPRAGGVGLAVTAAVAWGMVPIGGKIALPGMSASVLSTLRLLVAGAFLAVVIGRTRGASRVARPTRVVLLAALGLAGNYVGYMWGLERAGASTAQVLIQTAPLFLIVLSVLFLGERMRWRQAASCAVALLGVAITAWRDPAPALDRGLGIALILLAALSWSLYALLHARLGREHGSTGTMMWIFLAAGVLCAPVAAAEPMRRPDAVQVAAIAFLCADTIVGYWAFAEALRRIDASLVAIICTLGPVVTLAILAATNQMDQDRVPHEPLSWMKLGGAALVIAGVASAIAGRSRETGRADAVPAQE